MDQPAVAHALYELSESDWFTYVPPFRGRAIRMLKRDVPFEDLEIDFEALEKRKAAEYDKLNRMVRFALSGACRQQEILHYFGEGEAGPVPSLRQLPQAPAAATAAVAPRRPTRRQSRRRPEYCTADKLVAEEAVEQGVIEAVRMVLSGVARAESRIACGKNLIAQMLCGSNSAKIKKLRLNQLSTFGLLWQLKQAEVATLIDILIAIGCLEQEEIDRFRPVLKLTPLGGDVMRGKADLPAGLKLPGELRLKLRRPKAAAQKSEVGGQRPERQAPSRPRSVQPLDQPPDVADDNEGEEGGAGGQKSTVLPSALVPATAEYEHPPDDDWIIGSTDEGEPGDSFEGGQAPVASTYGQPDVPDAIGPRPSEQAPAAANRPSYYWTWRLLSQGFPADECLAIRGITRETLLDHACQAAENGLEVRAAWCLSAETIAAMDAVIGDNRPKQIRPLLAQLPPGTRYEEVQVYLQCR